MMKDEAALFIFLLCFYFGYLSATGNDINDERMERVFHEMLVVSPPASK